MGKHKPLKAWRDTFLDELRSTGNVRLACRKAGIKRGRAYYWRDKDTAAGRKFREAWDEAIEDAVDLLEGEARRRAVVGVEEGVYYQGERVDTVRKYSDGLLSLLLKAHRPDKYRERSQVEHTGEGGGPVAVIVMPDNGRGDAGSS